MAPEDIETSIKETLSGHGDYRDCPGAECTVCKTARDHIDWPPDIPYIFPSRLRVDDRDTVMIHYKGAKRDAWKEIQGEDDTPAEALRPQPQVLVDLESDPNAFLDRANAFLNTLRT